MSFSTISRLQANKWLFFSATVAIEKRLLANGEPGAGYQIVKGANS